MALIVDRQLTEDAYQRVADGAALPPTGPLLVSLATWRDNETDLRGRSEPVGIQLQSDEHPEAIADVARELDLVALEFPTFRDGRAYSYARLLRERYGFTGQLRATGDVLLEQLHYMERVGFNAFDIDSADPLADFATADRDFSVWYQASGDDRQSAASLRSRRARSD